MRMGTGTGTGTGAGEKERGGEKVDVTCRWRELPFLMHNTKKLQGGLRRISCAGFCLFVPP
jgi:hypothetical protein